MTAMGTGRTMPGVQHAPSSSDFESGHCEVGGHARCRITYAGLSCTCACHTTPPDPLQSLIAFLQGRRRDTLRALRACTDANADYWRWQGHAELSRQALQLLDAEVPQ